MGVVIGPAYLEPRTDVPAVEDWSTKLILAELRSAGVALGMVAVVCTPLAVATLVLLPTTPGSVATVVVVGLMALLGALGPLMYRVETRGRRRGLLDGPWRRYAATAVARADGDLDERLLVFGDDGPFALHGILPDIPETILDRQELFLCGPDASGRAVLRVAGLCRMHSARVHAGEGTPREREPHVSDRPLDDPSVARAFRGFRWGTRAWLAAAVPATVGATLLALSVHPLAPVGLVVGGLLLLAGGGSLPATRLVSGWYREAVASLRAAPAWTPVPVTLFPWEPNREVAGLAQLPGGMALVQFPFPQLDVVANVAHTGTLWLAGTTGVVVAGMPRVPALTVAVIQPDRDVPDETPPPWLLRGKEPALHHIPALRGRT